MIPGITAARIAGGGGPPTYATWDASRKTAGFTLSASDMQADEATTNNDQVIATLPKATGKWYAEIVCSLQASSPFDCFIGMARADESIAAFMYTMEMRRTGALNARSSGASSGTGAGYNSGDVVMLAFDASAQKLWLGVNGVWAGGGSPTIGTDAQFFGFTIGTGWSPYAVTDNTSAQHRFVLNTGATAFAYTPPSGFSAWTS